jgi:hypothetical protein
MIHLARIYVLYFTEDREYRKMSVKKSLQPKNTYNIDYDPLIPPSQVLPVNTFYYNVVT